MELLYSDDRVAVVVKPPGVLSTDEPGGMPALIRQALGGENTSVRSVHRLDRAVGGVMVYARTRRAASELSAQLREGLFHKQYLAVSAGVPEHLRGEMRDWLLRDTAAKKTLVVPETTPGAKEAMLSYARLSARNGMSLLSVSLHTGRTHQIRCQLSARGLPIWGDRKYGGPEGEPIALWSCRISFLHPRTKERMAFIALPPPHEPWTDFGQDIIIP